MTHTPAAVTATVTAIGSRRPARVGPVRMCPAHHTELDGGPVLYRCETGRHAVYAADLPTETARPLVPTGRAAA